MSEIDPFNPAEDEDLDLLRLAGALSYRMVTVPAFRSMSGNPMRYFEVGERQAQAIIKALWQAGERQAMERARRAREADEETAPPVEARERAKPSADNVEPNLRLTGVKVQGEWCASLASMRAAFDAVPDEIARTQWDPTAGGACEFTNGLGDEHMSR